MTYEGIKDVLSIDGNESPVFMPNELFKELQNYMIDSSHIAYAYCYLYLIYFLYRNCKYFNVSALLDNNTIKQILGYSKSNRTMNYITQKDDGILDANGFTKSVKDYPVSWERAKKEDVEFTLYSAMGDMYDVLPEAPRMFFLKEPLLALTDERVIERVKRLEDGEEQTEEVELRGTFYDFEQTTQVDFDIFMFCMSRKELGVIAFYLYSWIKHKNDIHGGYDVPLTRLSEETGIINRTLNQYIDALRGYRMVKAIHNMDCFSWTATKEERMANTYFVQSFDLFSDVYKSYAKMKVKTKEEYEYDRNKRKEEEEMKKTGFGIALTDLPF